MTYQKPTSYEVARIANYLRADLKGEKGSDHAPYFFLDHRKKPPAAIHNPLGNECSMVCKYCHRTIAHWGKRLQRSAKNATLPSFYKAWNEHNERCALGWLIGVLAKYSADLMRADEHDITRTWARKYMREEPGEDTYGDYGRTPPELKGIWQTLPDPPNSEKSHIIEMALTLISRVWEPN